MGTDSSVAAIRKGAFAQPSVWTYFCATNQWHSEHPPETMLKWMHRASA